MRVTGYLFICVIASMIKMKNQNYLQIGSEKQKNYIIKTEFSANMVGSIWRLYNKKKPKIFHFIFQISAFTWFCLPMIVCWQKMDVCIAYVYVCLAIKITFQKIHFSFQEPLQLKLLHFSIGYLHSFHRLQFHLYLFFRPNFLLGWFYTNIITILFFFNIFFLGGGNFAVTIFIFG